VFPERSVFRCRFILHYRHFSLQSEIDLFVETRPQDLPDNARVNVIALLIHRALFTEIEMKFVRFPD
jgi:hypothetical protein